MAGGPSRALLYGGGQGDETWEWDGKAWSQHVVPGPSPRGSAAMAAWGPKVLLFGGVRVSSGSIYEYLSDTWEWDGREWKELAAAGPPGVASSFMAKR